VPLDEVRFGLVTTFGELYCPAKLGFFGHGRKSSGWVGFDAFIVSSYASIVKRSTTFRARKYQDQQDQGVTGSLGF
jgi:hypothetical protein